MKTIDVESLFVIILIFSVIVNIILYFHSEKLHSDIAERTYCEVKK